MIRSARHLRTAAVTLGRGLVLSLVCVLLLFASLAFGEFAQAAAPAWRIAAVTGPTNLPPRTSEIQRVSVDATGGAFTLSLEGQTTAPIASDAAPAAFAAALEALPAIGAAAAEVSGGPGDAGGTSSYFVRFAGSLAGINVPDLVADPGGLRGGSATATVTTQTEGGAPGKGLIAIYVQNVGGEPAAGALMPIEVVDTLPTGLTALTASGEGWSCSVVSVQVNCTFIGSAAAGLPLSPVLVTVGVESPSRQLSPNAVSVAGGGAATRASYGEPVTVSDQPAPAGIQAFQAGAYDEDGNLDTRAGAHPFQASTVFFLNTITAPNGTIVAAGDPRDIDVELPPGFIGNPLASPRCLTEGGASEGPAEECPATTAVGFAQAMSRSFVPVPEQAARPVYNDTPAIGYPAEFAFKEIAIVPRILGSLRSDGDYGITVTSPNTPQYYNLYGAFVGLCSYGAVVVPARGASDGCRIASDPGANEQPLLTNASNCAEEGQFPPLTELMVNTWQEPNRLSEQRVVLPSVVRCSDLSGHFNPALSFRPDSAAAASPAAFAANLKIPQEGLREPDGLAAPDLKKAVGTLPRGVDVNPASADGLEACSEEQMGLLTTEGAAPNRIRFDKAEPTCPEASKLGTVEAKSPLIEETLGGTIYLAAQEENPFHSLLAIYAVIDSPRNGIMVKLPGEVRPDPSTGQLTATFDDNPQLPVEDLKLNFRGGGPHSPLATPSVCGTYTTHGELTPWSAPESGPPAQTEDSFQISSGPGGGACASSESGLPFSPSFEAGTTSTQAGEYAPLVVKVARRDGEQELTHIDFTLPPGATGKLAGIPYCPESAIEAAKGKTGKAEQASPSCPAASEIGTVDTSAGVGGEPIHVGGHVYLAGPYEGAPLSAVVITPAVAGPFDLGDVVVRTPLLVDPETAQITARSDEIPHILKGIPLQVRSLEIRLSRQDFTLNPTSCNAMTATSVLSGLNGATATPSTRFQVGGCQALKFKPRLKLSLSGSTEHAGHPALKAVLTYPKKGAYANIRRAQVNLPHSEFIDQANLNKTCTKPVLLAGQCPKSTIYGKAKAWTPLLEKPLEGNVYLVGGYGYKLPALVADLNGQIRVVLKGKVDSGPNHGIRNTFEAVPDAPVSRFVLQLKGGKKYSLLENSENLCRKPQRAIARFTGQNGKVEQLRPLISNSCKLGHKKKHQHHGSAKRRHR